MKKIILLLAVLALSLGAFGCGGGGAGSSSSPTGENPGIPSLVQLSASHAIAQTNASVTLSAKVLDGNGAPLSGVQVIFTNLSEPFGVIKTALRLLGISKPIGVLSATVVTTDGSGLARVKLSSTTPGFATIQAEINNGVGVVRAKKTIFFSSFALTLPTPPPPPPPTLTLDVDDGNGIYNQPDDFLLFKTATDNQRTIRATVRNGSGNPVMNATVTFGADSTEVTFPLGNIKTTDSNGQAFVLIQVDPSILRNLQTVVNITASTTVDGQDAFNLVSLTLSPVTISTTLSSVTANPAIVSVGGTSAVTATVILNTGGPAPDGTAINFTTAPKTGTDPSPCGFITPFSQLTGGVTTPPATFTAPLIPGTCTVTARTGGVTIGTVDILVVAPLLPLSVQPGTQTVNGVTGGTATFTIFGGLPGYTVTSANPAIAFNGTAGNGIWTVASSGGTFVVTVPAGTPATTVVLTVRDSAATEVAATLTIAGPGTLVISPKIASVASSGIAQTLAFTISGGTPGTTGYITTSSDPSKAFNTTAGVGLWTGSPITVTFPAGVAAGSVTLNVFDSLGATTTATITIVGPAPSALQISPKLVSVVSSGLAQTIAFTISGGTAPYVTTSTDPTKVFDSASGDGIWNVAAITANIPANVTAGSVTLNVLDAVGGTTTATITIIAPSALPLQISPKLVSVVSSGLAQTIAFTISGGTAPYVTTSTDPTKVFDTVAGDGIWNVAALTANIPANVTAGSVTLNVLDAVGGTTSATITIIAGGALSLSPASVSLTGLGNISAANTVTFTITGGTPDYSMFSSNTAVIPSQGALGAGVTTFVVQPASVAVSTPVTITVVDSVGATKTATVTVTPLSAGLTLNPSAITVLNGTVIPYFIFGGFPPYPNVFRSDTCAVIAGVGPSQFTVTPTGCPVGDVIITVVDSASVAAISTITIP